MLVRFWGVRGSLPSPLLPSEIKSKISAIIEQMTPEDIASAESRQRFIDGLPPWLYGTVGGNSPCISLAIEGFDEPVVFDCGSGIRELGIASVKKNPVPLKYHILLSHFHWDHLLGFPFFYPAYNPGVTLDFYSPLPDIEPALNGQMCPPYFPVTMETMQAKMNFYYLQKPIRLGPATVEFRKLNHPGESYAFLVRCNEKRFIYATDVELTASDFNRNEENTRFFRDADMIVIDAQYTLGEAIDKYNWGHSAFSISVDFAASWGIKHVVFFHHDPSYDDRKLAGILQSARWYIRQMGVKGMEVSLATEEMEISL